MKRIFHPDSSIQHISPENKNRKWCSHIDNVTWEMTNELDRVKLAQFDHPLICENSKKSVVFQLGSFLLENMSVLFRRMSDEQVSIIHLNVFLTKFQLIN